MSDIEEPPAKVLKIDNVNGSHIVETSVTIDKSDLSELATADEATEDGQEEWLSEGVLTDDDFNNSQADTHTDSQLGSSLDENQINEIEILDSSIDSEPYHEDNKEISKIDEIANLEELSDTTNIDENDEDITGDIKTANINDGIVNINKNKVTENTNDNKVTINTNDNDVTADTNDSDKTDVEIEEHNPKETVKADHKDTIQDDKLSKKTNTIDNKEEIKEITVTTVIDCAEKIAKSRQKLHTNLNINKVVKVDSKQQNIEETIEHMDSKKDGTELAESKVGTDKNTEQNKKVDSKKESDGNDTDDLLRMLEGDGKSKKLTKTVKDLRRATPGDASSDDDDFVYEGVTKKLKAAQTIISKKQPTKAVSEDFDSDGEDEESDDDAATLRRVFGTKGLSKNKRITENSVSRSNDLKKSSNNTVTLVERVKPKTPDVKEIPKSNSKLPNKPTLLKAKTPDVKEIPNSNSKLLNKTTLLKDKSTPMRQYPPSRSILKTSRTDAESKNSVPPKKDNKIKLKPEVLTPAPFRSCAGPDISDIEDILDEHKDERLNTDDDFEESDLDDEMPTAKQNMMNPETMDEEVPSDCDTYSEDGSLYDELPSSDSEDMDDWFVLDIRAEKAGDYIPLLGTKAKELLLEEKRSVSLRLQSLRQSVSALTASARQQADQLREATMTLANIDDMIKAI